VLSVARRIEKRHLAKFQALSPAAYWLGMLVDPKAPSRLGFYEMIDGALRPAAIARVIGPIVENAEGN
jgi:hypothetical protein